MQQVRIHGPFDVRLDEVGAPRPGPRDALVRIAACGVCGSDLKYIEMGGLMGPSGTPMPLGHEAAGLVEWVGSEVAGFAVGDRAVVHPGNDELGRIGNGASEGALTPSLLVREVARGGRLFRVPEGLSLEIAAFAEPLAVGMHAVEQAEVKPGDKVVVFGCGSIGLAAVATLLDRGIDDVVAVDLSARRRDLAVGLGARAAIDPVAEDLWARLATLHGTVPFMFGPAPATRAYIEASGAPSVIKEFMDHAAPHSRLSVVALHYKPISTSFLMILMKQLTIRGAMEYPARFEDALDLLVRRDLSSIVTHRFPIDGFGEALELLRGSKDCGKVMITLGAAC